jgi:hypothetical protein
MIDMGRSNATANGEPQRPRNRWLIIVLLLGSAAVIGLVVWMVLPSQMGDDAPDGLVIQNKTNEPLTVLIVAGDGTRPKLADVPPLATVRTFDSCGAAELVAVDRSEIVVARRPASNECDLTTWVIEAG